MPERSGLVTFKVCGLKFFISGRRVSFSRNALKQRLIDQAPRSSQLLLPTSSTTSLPAFLPALLRASLRLLQFSTPAPSSNPPPQLSVPLGSLLLLPAAFIVS